MAFKCGSEGTDYTWYDLNRIDEALATMRKYGIPEISQEYQRLYEARLPIMKAMGLKVPRIPIPLKIIPGLSPGIIKVWFDPEVEWFSEARAKQGAPPIYRKVSDEIAMAILKKEVTPELEEFLLTPDDYLGE